MNGSETVTMIQTLGFPIVVSIFCFYFIHYLTKNILESISKINESQEKISENLVEMNKTIVILSERISKIEKGEEK